MRIWLIAKRKGKGMSIVNVAKFNAYIGLEMVMSLVFMNTIDQFWCCEMFSGQADFKSTMLRPIFTGIRSNISLCNPDIFALGIFA